MGYSGVVARAWRDNVLISALIELTYRCNLKCFYCYNDLGLAGQPLSESQHLALLEELAGLDVLHVTFTGGEPLACPHFFALGRRARELGFVLRVKSNGHTLGRTVATRLRDEVDPFLIEVSLHGSCSATHDRQTQVAGSFRRLLRNLEGAVAIGLHVKLNATLTAWNEHEIEAMFALADRLGLPLAFSPTVTPRDDGDTTPLEIAPSRAGVERLYRFLDAKYPDAASALAPGCTPAPTVDKNCGAGSAGIAIDPFGNVYPCVQWRRSLGNLHQHRLAEIWRSSPRLAEIRDLTVAAKKKRDALGTLGKSISFCPGLSEELTGDPLGLEAGAISNAMQLIQVRRTQA
ncbi:MAG: radical SAM protein [Acidobacteriota bacterium]